MKYFAGLDVSLEETAICVVDETGRITKEVARVERTAGAGERPAEDRPAAGADRAGGLFADGVAA